MKKLGRGDICTLIEDQPLYDHHRSTNYMTKYGSFILGNVDFYHKDRFCAYAGDKVEVQSTIEDCNPPLAEVKGKSKFWTRLDNLECKNSESCIYVEDGIYTEDQLKNLLNTVKNKQNQ